MSGKDYHHLEVGSNLGQYTVERILGKGGMGQVYGAPYCTGNTPRVKAYQSSNSRVLAADLFEEKPRSWPNFGTRYRSS